MQLNNFLTPLNTMFNNAPQPIDPSGDEAVYTRTPGLLEYLDKKTGFTDTFRDLGWDALKSLCKILDGVFDAFNKLLSLNFYNIPGVKQFVSKTVPIAWAAFGLALVIGAIFLVINKDKLKISDFMRNILVSAALIVALPFSINVLNDMKNAGVSDMQQELKQNNTLGKTILGSVTVDVEYSSGNGKISTLLDSNLNAYTLNITDTLNKGTWDYEVTTKQINFNQADETVSYADTIKRFFEISDAEYATYFSLSAADKATYFDTHLKSRLVGLKNNIEIGNCKTLEDVFALYPMSLNAKTETTKPSLKYIDYSTGTAYYLHSLNDGDVAMPIGDGEIHVDFLEEYIYAYKCDLVMGLLLVIVTIIALFFAGFKVVGLLFDLAFNQLIAPIVFATDLQGSGRTKKMIENIVSSYLVFIIVLVLVKMYLLINTWAISSFTDTKDIFIKLIILVGTAKSVIDGPDIIVKLLGVDAGVKSGAAAMLGIQSAGRFANSAMQIPKTSLNRARGIIGAPSNFVNSAKDNIMRDAQRARDWSQHKEQSNSSWADRLSSTAQPKNFPGSSSGADDTATPKGE